jgi:hypothetical protein
MNLNDKVLVHIQSRPYESRRLSIGKIIGETKTAWRVKYGDNLGNPKELFRKKDLHRKGASEYSCTKILPWSDEEWDKYRGELLRRTIIRTLSSYEWDKIDTDTLKEIHSIAHKAKYKS